METLTAVPRELIAGNTWTWTVTYDDFPAGTWTLAYHFRKAAHYFDISGAEVVASGTAFVVTATAATTAGRVAGTYAWEAYATNGTVRYLAAHGEVVVKPNMATAAVLDTRSNARKMLDAIDAYLIDSNNLAAARYQIGGRSLDRWPRDKLLEERSRLKFEVQGEQAAAGGPDSRRSYVRFGARG